MSKTWVMPKWMEPYRALIIGNGEPIETLMNDKTSYQINGPRALIAAGVRCQVGLLYRLRQRPTDGIDTKHGKYYEGQLRELTQTVTRVASALDQEMRRPSSFERGKRIAKIINALEWANDCARHFGLGIPLKEQATDPVKR